VATREGSCANSEEGPTGVGHIATWIVPESRTLGGVSASSRPRLTVTLPAAAKPRTTTWPYVGCPGLRGDGKCFASQLVRSSGASRMFWDAADVSLLDVESVKSGIV